jgi:hypothetical protein
MRAATTADTAALVRALDQQAGSASPLAWPLVRSILAALNQYWKESERQQLRSPFLLR